MSPQMVTGQETSTTLLSYNIESNAKSTLTLDKELRYGFKLVAINSKIFNKNEDLQDQTLTNNVDDDDKNDDFMIIMKVFLMNMSGTPPPFSSMPESKNSFFARSFFLLCLTWLKVSFAFLQREIMSVSGSKLHPISFSTHPSTSIMLDIL